MLRRVSAAFRYAVREDDFLQVLTLTFSLSQDWNPVDALYFSVSTLTTTSVSNPDLVLQETLRRLGFAFIEVRRQESLPDQRSS